MGNFGRMESTPTMHHAYTELWDYIHMYIGHECVTEWENISGGVLSSTIMGVYWWGNDDKGHYPVIQFDNIDDLWEVHELVGFKLLLRKIEDMPFPIKQKYYRLCKRTKASVGKYITSDTPASLIYAISQGYDVFDLIEKGFAIDRFGMKKQTSFTKPFIERQPIYLK